MGVGECVCFYYYTFVPFQSVLVCLLRVLCVMVVLISLKEGNDLTPSGVLAF